MRKTLGRLSITFLIVLLLSSCSDSNNGIAEKQISDISVESPPASSVRHCFRNEYPIDDNMDVEELIVEISDNHATGQFNWIPAYKDKRLGRFSGSIQDNTITAGYDFEQEGLSDTVTITISIEEEKAVVAGGPPELGLNVTLVRVGC